MSLAFTAAWDTTEGTRWAQELFTRTFGETADRVAFAPGRVNLIGEHTDYNAGLCLPIALPHRTYVALSMRSDNRIRLVSEHGELWEGAVDDINPAMPASWVSYAAGPTWALDAQRGYEAAIVSCVPLGAGLSSSAALECAMACAINPRLIHDDPGAVVTACIRAENEIAHAPTGGMDQTVSVFGEEGAAVALDFDSHTHTLIPADFAAAGLQLVVINTRAKHSLSDGQYGNRRQECEKAANLLGHSSLREANVEDIARLSGVHARRARHVITENARVTRAIGALSTGDFHSLGKLFNESHVSLRDDFEVSCPELDCVVETARQHGALGARMTGGGFGGSAIALVPLDKVDALAAGVRAAAEARGFPTPELLLAHASCGAQVVSEEASTSE
ncbi:MAG: galactokinase [Actinotignum sanguinis]|uniref:galactokinase n=1 Tax=Actinotignum sanguinis TaxID=1445614 RepID=UPI002549C72D|nr:galactokinase [Actinotignum sanguinis]MDK8286736.1 galactokinase [Actinotignum sanguinis]MDK8352644.1 galactokinase [Actinotignum sanguinis]MDK8651573.1 galactokinase [Actinotignum sanguinis]MDK8802002.1 galactokinase [Actinotignum sanguinis]